MNKLLLPVSFSVLIAVAFVGGAMLSVNKQASARPQYAKTFFESYPENKEAAALAANAKCSVCHPAAAKKERNDYGVSLSKLVGGKDQKDVEKIKEALKKNEAEKSSVEGKTFGDLLKEGKLPGK